MFEISLRRKLAKAVHTHRKVMDAVQNHRVHRHVFRYAVTTHFIHVAVSAGSLRSVDAVIAFAASLGTLLLHITEKDEAEKIPGGTGPQLWSGSDLLLSAVA